VRAVHLKQTKELEMTEDELREQNESARSNPLRPEFYEDLQPLEPVFPEDSAEPEAESKKEGQ
jgi:hypothetical protein